MELKDLTITEFLDTTSSKQPVPGGGSVSALCAALAAALTTMVTGLTIGRKKYADVEEDMSRVAEKAKAAIAGFTAAIDADSAAYAMVMDAYKAAKANPDDPSNASRIQGAVDQAAAVPFGVAIDIVALMPSIAEVAAKGNRNAVTDAAVAMMAARTAALGAILNVRINLQSLDDQARVEFYSSACDQLQQEAIERESALLNNLNL